MSGVLLLDLDDPDVLRHTVLAVLEMIHLTWVILKCQRHH